MLLAEVDIDAGVTSKFGELVMDADMSALRVLLLGHMMEKKHGDLQVKYKNVSEDVDKWKNKVTGLEARLKEVLE